MSCSLWRSGRDSNSSRETSWMKVEVQALSKFFSYPFPFPTPIPTLSRHGKALLWLHRQPGVSPTPGSLEGSRLANIPVSGQSVLRYSVQSGLNTLAIVWFLHLNQLLIGFRSPGSLRAKANRYQPMPVRLTGPMSVAVCAVARVTNIPHINSMSK